MSAISTVRRTAAETILVAAASFKDRDFTKWELAIAAWQLDKARFGMKGFETEYPDMNRVLMELVGAKPSSPVKRGHLECPAPSTYRLTARGKSLAAAMIESVNQAASPNWIYKGLQPYLRHPVLASWQSDPSEPRELEQARDFLSVGGMGDARQLIRAAYRWFVTHGVYSLDYYQPAVRVASIPSPPMPPPIESAELADLSDFLTALGYRFPQLVGKQAKCEIA